MPPACCLVELWADELALLSCGWVALQPCQGKLSVTGAARPSWSGKMWRTWVSDVLLLLKCNRLDATDVYTTREMSRIMLKDRHQPPKCHLITSWSVQVNRMEQERDRAGVLNTAPVWFNVVGLDEIQNNNLVFLSSSVFNWNHPEESRREY